MRKLGVLGCGSIGTELARFAQGEPRIDKVLLFDARPERAEALGNDVAKGVVCDSFEAFLDGCDFVAEAASQDAVRERLTAILEAGRDVMVMSMGALADDAYRKSVVDTARRLGRKIYLPSGAIAGVDGLKAGSLAGLKSVTLVTTKPPAGLGVKVDRWTILFDGPAREAVKRYPQNVNVAAALAIAGVGFDQTRVQVVADPLATRNHHKVIIEGAFGRIRCEVENLPSPQNPKTSWLASLSAIATLQRLLEPVQMGA